jgi:hypothetical protein
MFFRDDLYGFLVVPKIRFPDFFRYLHLPSQPRFRNLFTNKIYRQINDYIIYSALVRPQIFPEITNYLSQKILELYRPLVQSLIKAKRRDGAISEVFKDEDLESAVFETIEKKNFFGLFEPFYATFGGTPDHIAKTPQGSKKEENFVKKWQEKIIAPVGVGNRLVIPGMIGNLHEYPFTAYFKEKVTQLIDEFFEGYGSVFESNSKELDEFSESNFSTGYPPYNFLDDQGTRIGWMIKTFAGIVGISYETLKRWQREGLLIGRQTNVIYKKFGGKRFKYRYYTEEDIKTAKEVRILKQRKVGRKRNAPEKIV